MCRYDEAADFEHHRSEAAALEQALAQAGAGAFIEGTHVLDIGGGGGNHAGFLAARAARVTTVDVVDPNVTFGGEFLKLLKEKYARHAFALDIAKVEFQRADAMNLPYRDALFDLVVSFNAFEHIPDPEKALREALRVTRPGGYLFISFDPIWTADTGSHFADFVPEPWAHLVLGTDDFAAKMAAAGAEPWQVEEFRCAMNRVRLAVFNRMFNSIETYGHGIIKIRNAWSGTVDPASTTHRNFRAAKHLGYSEHELLTRGLSFVVQRSARTVSGGEHAENIDRDVCVAEVRVLEEKLCAVETQLASVLRSRSWRVTAPLRALSRAIRR